MAKWDPELYQGKHSFVWEYGRELIAVLRPQPGEKILDAGCGTGQLTAEIAAAGAVVTGIDNSSSMIAEARKNYPNLSFEHVDMARMKYDREFNAVFSNAALHWVRDAGAAAAGMARALLPGGRLVMEMGGKGNLRQLQEAVGQAFKAMRLKIPESPWFNPSLAEYAGMLERHGLEVTYALLFDRPTPLSGKLEDWLMMFGEPLIMDVAPDRREAFVRQVVEYARPALWREGKWIADYRRLRVVAISRRPATRENT